ncbi:MAG: LuxR C-terminal-related transcriptional regulator [Acidobacteriia bacterium]|nr:LuxR C-terminal-related transcriptional regulator [Terriglobia bacterium]
MAAQCGSAAEVLDALRGGGGYRGKILMFTAGTSAKESSVALQLGASGIFLQLMAEGVQRRDEPEEANLGKLLTEREQRVLRAIFEGLSNKEIAARIGVSEGAIKATLQQLFQKTGVRTRSQLVRIALEASLATGRRSGEACLA